jgi:hypothetical protein
MSHDSVKAAFEKQVVLLPLDIILPQNEVTQSHRSGEFYKQLTASLKHHSVRNRLSEASGWAKWGEFPRGC